MTGDDIRIWLGVAGVAPNEDAVARHWDRRLHWLMIIVALAALPAFYLIEHAEDPLPRAAGYGIEALVLFAFIAEYCWMLGRVRAPMRYVARNWLGLVIIVTGFLSLAGASTGWIAIGRLLRSALVALLLTRAVGAVRLAFLPSSVPYVVGFAILSLALAGAGFYYIEPTINSYGEGLWLAFVTGTTVGYGDYVPTTWPARLFAALMVVIGFTLLSVVTASIVAFFVGEDEKRLRRETHRDLRDLRERFEVLIGDEERVLRREMHQGIRELLDKVERLVGEEERELRHEIRADMRELRDELAALRARFDRLPPG